MKYQFQINIRQLFSQHNRFGKSRGILNCPKKSCRLEKEKLSLHFFPLEIKELTLILLFFRHLKVSFFKLFSFNRYNRDWRYHKEERVWITRAPGMPPSEKTAVYERGTYYFFDVSSWR